MGGGLGRRVEFWRRARRAGMVGTVGRDSGGGRVVVGSLVVGVSGWQWW